MTKAHRKPPPKWPRKLTREDMFYRTADTDETMEEYFEAFTTEQIRRAMKILERRADRFNLLTGRWGK